MLDKIIDSAKSKMDQVISHFQGELKSLHAGRASAGLVEDLPVSHYNSTMPIKQLASITIPDAASICITPWDKGALQPIETAIRGSNLSVNPINDGNSIRINLPPPSQDRRNELISAVNRKAEDGRIALRQIREDAWKSVQSSEKSGDLTEDDRYSGEKQLNKLIEEFNNKVKSEVDIKEKEIQTI